MACASPNAIYDFLAQLTFFGYLPELLSRRSTAGSLTYPFNQRPAIKDAIEACGVPHTEVDVILAEQRSVDFSYQLRDGDNIRVYPPRYRLGLAVAVHLAEESLEQPSFILDVHLGKLARKLRFLGFDCSYRNDYSDRQIVDLALSQKRTVLTRDRGLLKYARLSSGLLIRYDHDLEQTAQVLNRYLLWPRIALLQRCMNCNGLLEPVEKELIAERLEPMTLSCCENFWRCRDCDQLYWQGGHAARARQWFANLRKMRQLQGDTDE